MASSESSLSLINPLAGVLLSLSPPPSAHGEDQREANSHQFNLISPLQKSHPWKNLQWRTTVDKRSMRLLNTKKLGNCANCENFCVKVLSSMLRNQWMMYLRVFRFVFSTFSPSSKSHQHNCTIFVIAWIQAMSWTQFHSQHQKNNNSIIDCKYNREYHWSMTNVNLELYLVGETGECCHT